MTKEWKNRGLLHIFRLYAKGVDDEEPSPFKHFLILNRQRLVADVASTQIYGLAKKSVLIVDDFLNVKPLRAKTFYF